jgi:hypothetical protein
MICPTCRFNDPPGFVRNGPALEPCPDCGGTMVAHCCDGLTACNDPVEEAVAADAADEARYQLSRPSGRRKAARRRCTESTDAIRCVTSNGSYGWKASRLWRGQLLS